MLSEIIELLLDYQYYKNDTYYGIHRSLIGYEYRNDNEFVIILLVNRIIITNNINNNITKHHSFNDFHDYLINKKRKNKIKQIKKLIK